MLRPIVQRERKVGSWRTLMLMKLQMLTSGLSKTKMLLVDFWCFIASSQAKSLKSCRNHTPILPGRPPFFGYPPLLFIGFGNHEGRPKTVLRPRSTTERSDISTCPVLFGCGTSFTLCTPKTRFLSGVAK